MGVCAQWSHLCVNLSNISAAQQPVLSLPALTNIKAHINHRGAERQKYCNVKGYNLEEMTTFKFKSFQSISEKNLYNGIFWNCTRLNFCVKIFPSYQSQIMSAMEKNTLSPCNWDAIICLIFPNYWCWVCALRSKSKIQNRLLNSSKRALCREDVGLSKDVRNLLWREFSLLSLSLIFIPAVVLWWGVFVNSHFILKRGW